METGGGQHVGDGSPVFAQSQGSFFRQPRIGNHLWGRAVNLQGEGLAAVTRRSLTERIGVIFSAVGEVDEFEGVGVFVGEDRSGEVDVEDTAGEGVVDGFAGR